MKIKYGCDLCDQYFEKVEDAMKCEKSHNVVLPTGLWLVPVVGLVLWFSQVLKGNFVKFPKDEFGSSTFMNWILISPVIIGILIFILFLL